MAECLVVRSSKYQALVASWRICLVVATLAALAVAGCQNVDSPVQSNSRIETLIEQLASKNPAPELPWFGFKPLVPSKHNESYDVEKQQAVEDAYQELERLGAEAFPYLLAQLDDDRFSHTASSSIYYNVSVGETCRQLITESVDPVKVYSGKSDACDYFALQWDGNLKRWWRANKQYSLREMQIEALRFRVRKAESLGLSSDEVRDALDALLADNKSWRQLDEERREREGTQSFRPLDAILLWSSLTSGTDES